MQSVISNIYIKQVLNREAENLIQEQRRIVNAGNALGAAVILQKQSYTVANNTLTVTHAKQQRFIDMKVLRGYKRKPIKVHNTPIYNYYNYIINELRFGLTDDIKQMIAQEHNIQG
ncbi:hypothetical protein EZY14_002620 [Kordia sp. TARA_039_SRF]|nr:hypothetical protein EZY14_002620 [Kordia sp. TARA_039_SRF]